MSEEPPEPVETLVTDATYWSGRVGALCEVLPASTGEPVERPDGLRAPFAVAVGLRDPAFWAAEPGALAEALALASLEDRGVRARMPTIPPGERLTLTVEEAATALGLSRAFAYEAARRGEIPSIRIGRRILIPRAALQRLLDSPGGGHPTGDKPPEE